jgi:predicted Zn-dependent peptidase
MKIHKRTTKNGLKLLAVEMPGTNVVTTLILAGAGSRFENKKNAGISHFLEHMFFKGANKYKTPKAVAEAVDAFGGEFNAFTGKEYAGYYVKSGMENLDSACDVLSDMLLHSKFPKNEIEKERGVICEEMAMYLDAPMYQISWDFERLVFGDQPIGRDQIGTKDVILSVSQEDFLNYKNALYTPDNCVIIAAGAVNERTIDKLESFFAFDNSKKSIELKPFDKSLATKKFQLREKKTEQFHISFGVKALPECDPLFSALRILGTILGGNMSSRMFQNVREEKGLAYSIRTQIDEFTDTGLLATRAGVKLNDVLLAVSAIRFEYDNIRENGVSDAEFEKAKNFLLGKIDLTTEDTEEVAHHFAKNALLYSEIETFDEEKDKIRVVKKEEVNQLAKELFMPENFRFAGIGPAVDEAKLLKLIS